MEMNNFYALYPILDSNEIFFSTNNSIVKYNRITNQTETMLNHTKQITHLKKYNNYIIFRTSFEHYGDDIYLLNLKTNEIQRITFINNSTTIPIAFENNEITYITTAFNALGIYETFKYNIETKITTKLNYTNTFSIIKDQKDIYIQQNQYGYLFWKNYQGGKRGQIFKNQKPLIALKHQCINPVIFQDRVYFIYDKTNSNNIYSCTKTGKELKQHTFHKQFKILSLNIQNDEIIYSIMGELYIINLTANQETKLNIPYKINKLKEKQKLSVDFLTSIDIDMDLTSKKAVFAVRGNVFKKNIYGGSLQLSDSLRFTKVGFINNKIFAFKDGRTTQLYYYDENNDTKIFNLPSQKILSAKSNKKDLIAYINHKNELKIINLDGKETIIDKSEKGIYSFDWSSDGKWIVYSKVETTDFNANIFLYSVETKKIIQVTNDEYLNIYPKFDIDNRFIIFKSNRRILIEYDSIKFDNYGEIKQNLYIIPLIEDYDLNKPLQINETTENNKKKEWNLLNLDQKIIPLSLPYAYYFYPIKNKILFIQYNEYNEKNILKSFDLNTLETKEINLEFDYCVPTFDKNYLILFFDQYKKIKLLKIEELETDNNKIVIDLEKINLNCTTTQNAEFQNIIDEITWFMEEFYWNKIQAKQFKNILNIYKDHINKVNTIDEMYHILYQIQGEMKTSHAYVAHDYKKQKTKEGKIGCDFEYDPKKDMFFISHILKQNGEIPHPLYSHNTNIQKNSFITKINNIQINKNHTIEQALLDQENQDITIEIQTNNKIKTYEIKTISTYQEKILRYYDLITKRKNYILNQNKEIGYIHIPDMGKEGFKEFFIQYNTQYNKKCIIIDVRDNNGGSVSSLILEQLTKKKLGLDISRHNGVNPLENFCSEGNFVLLINSATSSDGEIFAESFKQLQLGQILGERTWGGIIGIEIKNYLINNALTTQPEFAAKFFNSTKEIENYGVTPDIEISDKASLIPEEDAILNEAIRYCKEKFL